MALNYDVLAQELTADPQAMGYAAIVANWRVDRTKDDQLAARLNDSTLGRTQPRTVIASYEIIAAFTPAQFALLDATQRQQLTLMLSGGQIDISVPNVRNTFLQLLPSPQFDATRQNLGKLQTRAISRAEELFQQAVLAGHIANARG